MDMQAFITPKSDQINADDLISGPITVTIDRVKIEAKTEQPVTMYLRDREKVYRPCKTMGKLMVGAWGNDSAKYAGRSLTLYRDDSVTWGGMKVGGIRISHMSHIDRDIVQALAETRKNRKIFTVKPLAVEPVKSSAYNEITPADLKSAREAASRGTDAFRQWCKENPIWKRIDAAVMETLHAVRKAADAADDPIAALTPDEIEARMAQTAAEFTGNE